MKNWAFLPNKATVAVSPKILQLHLSSEMFSAKYGLMELLSEFSQLLRFLEEQVRI